MNRSRKSLLRRKREDARKGSRERRMHSGHHYKI